MFQESSRITRTYPFREAAVSLPALSSATQAVTVILDAAKADRRRILVGTDAEPIDELVHQPPERA
jgi:hypothetical protein